MVSVISDSRIVPVSEDLTTEELRLSVLRGLERMNRVDQKSSSGLSLDQGEWGVLQSDGTVARPSAVPALETYLCFLGTTRFDARATGQVTLIMNSPVIVKSKYYDLAGSYVVGTLLTVKDLGAGEAGVTPGASGEYVFGKVLEVGQGVLKYEVFSNPMKMS